MLYFTKVNKSKIEVMFVENTKNYNLHTVITIFLDYYTVGCMLRVYQRSKKITHGFAAVVSLTKYPESYLDFVLFKKVIWL